MSSRKNITFTLSKGLTRSPFANTCAMVFAGITLSLSNTSAATTPAHPNVIMIYTDDMGYGDISSFSNALPVQTPNIDRLATEGMKFTQFYVSMPICSPSRAAVLSGMYSPESRLTNYLQTRDGNHASDGNDWMDPAMSFLPKTFQSAGYATCHVGKWHLGGGRDVDNAPSIIEYGYDEFYSTWESPNPDPQLGVRYAPWDKKTEPGQVPRHQRTEYMVNRTLDFLQRHSDKSCFITLWPDDLHTPYRPSPAMQAKYGGPANNDTAIKNFYGVLDEYDLQIGRLLDGLETQGLTTNTIVFFTGDNGPSPVYSNHKRADGMRGRKLSLYEGGIREPFIIRWPGHVPAGVTDSTTIMSTVDLLSTLAALAGIPLSTEAAALTDGEDLSQAVLGSPMQRNEPLFWEYGRTTHVPRPASGNIDRAPILAIRDGNFKLLINPDNSGAELYNLLLDRNETNNIAAQYPTVVSSLAQQVIAWRNTLPHRNQPYPAFDTVNFNQHFISECASAANLQAATGGATTAEIAGVSADPYWYGDVYAIHVDNQGKDTILRVDNGTGVISKITDSTSITEALGASPGGLSLLSGFEYAPGGNRLYLADNSLSPIPGQVTLIEIETATGNIRQVARSNNLSNLMDHSVLPTGDIAAVTGANGSSSIGIISPITGAWTPEITESQLIAASTGASSLPPQSVAANNGGGEIFVSTSGDFDTFEIPSITAGTPTITRLAQASLDNADFRDIACDQAGNMYALDDAGQRIVIVRAQDNLTFAIPYSQISQSLGGAAFIPTQYRGLAARMISDKQADLFIASSTSDYGIIKIRFGQPPAAVNDWTLYSPNYDD